MAKLKFGSPAWRKKYAKKSRASSARRGTKKRGSGGSKKRTRAGRPSSWTRRASSTASSTGIGSPGLVTVHEMTRGIPATTGSGPISRYVDAQVARRKLALR